MRAGAVPRLVDVSDHSHALLQQLGSRHAPHSRRLVEHPVRSAEPVCGARVVVYEAQGRVGGRVSTDRQFISGKLVEAGAELIGENHPLWWRLVRDDYDGHEDREVIMKIRGNELKFTAQRYLLQFAIPNFFFHVTTAYDILRHSGVPLGKLDYLGRY